MQVFSNLCQKSVYITQDASHPKQSKQNHTHAVRVSSTGRYIGKDDEFNISSAFLKKMKFVYNDILPRYEALKEWH